MDEGLLTGLASGLKSGIESYRTERAYQDQKSKEAEEEALKRRMSKAQLISEGLMENEGGELSKTPERKELESLEKITKQAGLTKTGFKADKDPVTGEYKMVPIAGFKDLEQENRKLQNEKLRKEISSSKPQKEPTSSEFAASGYAKRLEQAEDVFSGLNDKGFDATSIGSQVQKSLPGFLNALKDSDVQLQEQAERNFVNAILRRESGAAIAANEFESAEKQYFPRPGDSPEVLQQKALNRKIVRENIKAEAGPAYARSGTVQELSANLPSASKKEGKGLLTIESAQANQLSDEDKEAMKWAKERMKTNPKDPRIQQIISKIGKK